MRATAALVRRPQTSYAAPLGHEQGRAGSLHPEGRCSADQTWTGREVYSDPRRWARRLPTDSGAVTPCSTPVAPRSLAQRCPVRCRVGPYWDQAHLGARARRRTRPRPPRPMSAFVLMPT